MRKRNRIWRSVFPAVCLILLAVYMVLCAAVKPDRILCRTTVNGAELGGMTAEAATGILEEKIRSCLEESVLTISFQGDMYQVDVRKALEYDCEAAVEKALRPGRENFFLRGGLLLKAAFTGRELPLTPVADQGILQEAVRDSGLLEADSRTEPS